ncbi:YdiU family protein [Ideonella sp. DXS29W]|uniref:Protein nucleotidyltransferase YdiU n=1 Tax=Ideonella lacteola TaxID=2984193 RepID=A0ABU9BS07_9BURK
MPAFAFDNTYARELTGLYVPWQPASVPAPQLLFLNRPLAEELNLPLSVLEGTDGAALLAGNQVPEGAQPVAQAYAGHQFGGFSPQLGDGRALLLGEVIDRQGRRRDIAYKGSGRTPFARGGDGKAAIGPMLREAILGEAMHALGIPTTRALAVAATGEPVYREHPLPGAVLTRVAASHLRVGTFQYAAHRGDIEQLRRLADYTLARHDPGLVGQPDRYLGLLNAVCERQARLVAQWMNVGFIHGVMNTDNMALSGETIDYGPCAFMEAFDPRAVFSSIDQQGRYAYANQPPIAQWNLARLAEALLPLIAPSEAEADVKQAIDQVTGILSRFADQFERALREGQRAKLGLAHAQEADNEADDALVADWLAELHRQQVDFTLAWRRLADAAAGQEAPLLALFSEPQALQPWLTRWRSRCEADDASSTRGASPPTWTADRAERLRRANPFVIPRNHLVEEALEAATERDDIGPFERLLEAVRHPFDEAPERARYGEPAPAAVTACYRTFCGT